MQSLKTPNSFVRGCRVWVWLRVCSGHSFAHYITSFIAFIHIHLDICRIIIIITWSTNRNIPSSTTVLRWIQRSFVSNVYMLCNGMLRCVRKEGKVFFAFGSKNTKFRPQQSNLYMDEKVKIYYKVWTVIHNIVQSSITVFSTKLIQMFLSSMQAGLKRSFSSLQNVLRIINLRHHHPANKQTV